MKSLVARVREEPWLFIKAFAAPDDHGIPFSETGFREYVRILGYTEKDILDTMEAIVGFRPESIRPDIAAGGVPSTDNTDAASGKISVKAPPGLYRITKLGNQTATEKAGLGFFELWPQKSGWNHRRFKKNEEIVEARITYVEKDAVLDSSLVWRLQTSLQTGAQYHLGFWLEAQNDTIITRFAGTVSGVQGQPGDPIEGIMDEDLDMAVGGFLGRMLDGSDSQQPSDGSGEGNPPPDWTGVVVEALESLGFRIFSGIAMILLFVILFRVVGRYLQPNPNQNQNPAPAPIVNNPLQYMRDFGAVAPDGSTWGSRATLRRRIAVNNVWNVVQEATPEEGDDQEGDIEGDIITARAKKIRVLKMSCKQMYSFGEDDEEGSGSGQGGSANFPAPGSQDNPQLTSSLDTNTVINMAHATYVNTQSICEALVRRFARPLEAKANEVIQSSFTKFDELNQVVTPAQNEIINWPHIVSIAIKAAMPKVGDPSRPLIQVQKTYLDTLRPYVLQACMAYLTPVYAQFQSSPALAKILEVFAWPTFADNIIEASLLKSISSGQTLEDLASESRRVLMVQSTGMSSTTTGASGIKSFQAQQLGENIAMQLQRDAMAKIDGIRKLLESGVLTAQNIDQMFKEKLNLIRVGPDSFAPAALPSEWFKTGNAFMSLAMLATMTKLAGGGGFGGKAGANSTIPTGNKGISLDATSDMISYRVSNSSFLST